LKASHQTKKQAMSKITIVDLEVFFNVGVTDEERAKPQPLLVTVDMEFDFSSAAESDHITRTIDYSRVARQVLKYGQNRRWKLIEKLANDLADMILSKFKPQGVIVEVKKFPIPEARFVSVSLSKRRAAADTVKRTASDNP